VVQDPRLLSGEVATQTRVDATIVTGWGGIKPQPPAAPWRVFQKAALPGAVSGTGTPNVVPASVDVSTYMFSVALPLKAL
jgi:hypothetical protein